MLYHQRRLSRPNAQLLIEMLEHRQLLACDVVNGVVLVDSWEPNDDGCRIDQALAFEDVAIHFLGTDRELDDDGVYRIPIEVFEPLVVRDRVVIDGNARTDGAAQRVDFRPATADDGSVGLRFSGVQSSLAGVRVSGFDTGILFENSSSENTVFDNEVSGNGIGIHALGPGNVIGGGCPDLSLQLTGEANGSIGRRGDFDNDGRLTHVDIDLLSEATLVDEGLQDLRFDLTGDARVDEADRRVWVNTINRSFFGDANLDCRFDSGDLTSVFREPKYERPIAASWSEGNWNIDNSRTLADQIPMLFDSSDFVLAFQTGRYEKGALPLVARGTNSIRNNRVAGILIETDSTMVSANTIENNGGPGIEIRGSKNAIGSPANLFRLNSGAGVLIVGNDQSCDANACSNAVRGNTFTGRLEQAIDLAGDGRTANDESDLDLGPNGLQNSVTIQPASRGEAVLARIDTLGQQRLLVDFYSVMDDEEGQRLTFLKSFPVDTDADGDAVLVADFGSQLDGVAKLAATVTDQRNNTSEFSDVFGLTSISGMVRNQDGQPMEGVDVYIDADEDGRLSETDPTTATNLDGRYRFEGLAEGTYVVRQVVDRFFAQTLPKGQFVPATTPSENCDEDPPWVRSVVNNDFDADGDDDIAYVSDRTGELVIAINDGHGNFVTEAVLRAGDRPQSVLVTDIDGDQDADLIVTNTGTEPLTSTIAVFANENGSFSLAQRLRSGNGSLASATGDFDRDGDLDIAVINFRSRDITVLINGPDGLRRGLTKTLPSQPISLHAADLDRDGLDDILVGTSNGVLQLLNQGELSFAERPLFDVIGGVSHVTATNWNGSELVVMASEYLADAITIRSLRGELLSRMNLPEGARPHHFTLADVNADGRDDLVVAEGETNAVSIFEQGSTEPSSRFFTTDTPLGCGGGPQWIAAGQFTRDRNADIVTSSLNAAFRVFHYVPGQYEIELTAGQRVTDIDFDNLVAFPGQRNPAAAMISLPQDSAFSPVTNTVPPGSAIRGPVSAVEVIMDVDQDPFGWAN